jgi:hypothetical protein
MSNVFTGPLMALKGKQPMMRFIGQALGITALAALVAGANPTPQGCPLPGKEMKDVQIHKENTAMAVNPAQNITIPPIDAAAPANFETATFALG